MNGWSPEPNTDLALVTKQKQYGASLLGCEWSNVFPEVSADIGGHTTFTVEDYSGEFHQPKCKGTKSWVNWGMFYQVRLKVKEQDAVCKADGTVKVDLDAVFIPQRLRLHLSSTTRS